MSTATEHRVDYEPAESSTGLFGGNSNWRGPVWMPVNYLLIESLQKFHHYYGDDLKVECPTGSGNMMNLWEVSQELSRRLSRIFLQNGDGKRPVYGNIGKISNRRTFPRLCFLLRIFSRRHGRGYRRKSSNRLDGFGCQTFTSKRRMKMLGQ